MVSHHHQPQIRADKLQQQNMSAINIYTLPSTERSTSSDAASIRQDIEKGLIGSSEPTIPGKKAEDRRWSFSKSVPTVVLYDEQGLRYVTKYIPMEMTDALGCMIISPRKPMNTTYLRTS
jgi:hypothetical protein